MNQLRLLVEFATITSAWFSQTISLNLRQIDSNSEDSFFLEYFERYLSRTLLQTKKYSETVNILIILIPGSGIPAWSIHGDHELLSKDVLSCGRKDHRRPGRGKNFVYFNSLTRSQNYCHLVLIIPFLFISLQEGCWGLMDEFHRVNTECLSVMLFEIQAVLLAMRGGLSTCTLEDGKDVSNVQSVDRNIATK